MKTKLISSALAVLTLLSLLTLLCSCGASVEYKDDITSTHIVSELEKLLLKDDGYEKYSSAWVEIRGFDTEKAVDFCVTHATADMNEFGVFRAKNSSDAEAIKKSVEKYIRNSYEDKKQYASQYKGATELEKIEGSFVKVYGNYVVYAYLTKADGNTATQAIENMLKK